MDSSQKVFPHCFDPRMGLASWNGHSPQLLDCLAKVHLLLFDTVVVQDNFLVSQLYWQWAGSPEGSFIAAMIEEGCVQVALREKVWSLQCLRKKLLRLARKDQYKPFEDDIGGAIAMYEAADFKEYLDRVDCALSSRPGTVLSWSPKKLSKSYAQRMRLAIANGRVGIPEEYALGIWEQIDTTLSGKHSRSAYWRFAEHASDAATRTAIENWATGQYLVNLPLEYGLLPSAPDSVSGALGAVDPFRDLLSLPVRPYDEALFGLECALISPFFLRQLSN